MYLEIVTPDQKVFEGEVVAATFPGADGSFQVLDNHAPLLSILTKGTIVYKDKKNEYDVTINGGVVEVLHNKVIVLAEGLVEEE
ncbi:MAG TPA: ATP synthase F1 subunit epsilon [Flammeovirgaceae bacterium]|nr:ATP synthase F1 subunit epsilon [Flammeovirgaceae bacterium]